MGDTQRPQTHLFLVRVWLQDLGDDKTEWRGQVKHVMSGEVRYFRSWPSLTRHLKAILSSARETQQDLSMAKKRTQP